jgi:signal peptidase I
VETDSEPRPVDRVIDPYWVLGVGRDASPEQIEAAFRRASANAWSLERRREIENAHELLTSPERRAEYDERWRSERAALAPAPLPAPVHHSRNPVDRMTAGLPRPWRVAIDWAVTIVGAVAIVLAIKAWVVNPYRIPSSSMEPSLHCAVPGEGCEARFSDRVLANRLVYHFRDPKRGDIIVFQTPPRAALECGAGGTFVKRLIGLPGETWSLRRGIVYINNKPLSEPYIKKGRRGTDTQPPRTVPTGRYIFLGDNRTHSCDSRQWGSVPRASLIGKVFAVYWPPNRISIR